MIPTKFELRGILKRQLRTDDDLDAFCINHSLDDIKHRFSNGMTRVQKENLILELLDAAHLWELLNRETKFNYSLNPDPSRIDTVRLLIAAINQAYDSIIGLINSEVHLKFIEVVIIEQRKIFPKRSRCEAIEAELNNRHKVASEEIKKCLETWYLNKISIRASENEFLEDFFAYVKDILDRFKNDIIEGLSWKNIRNSILFEMLEEIDWPSLQRSVSELKQLKLDIEKTLCGYRN